jgi:hypothetical protein
MTDTNIPAIPTSLADMLPVGMLANGGLAAEAMSTLANRKQGTPDWEAFHYERISESQFEITGGVAVMTGGIKKWPGAHTTITLSEADIIEEMQKNQAAVTRLNPIDAASRKMPTVVNAPAARYLHVVFALPEDEAGKQRLLKAFHLQADFFGARVQACSLVD